MRYVLLSFTILLLCVFYTAFLYADNTNSKKSTVEDDLSNFIDGFDEQNVETTNTSIDSSADTKNDTQKTPSNEVRHNISSSTRPLVGNRYSGYFQTALAINYAHESPTQENTPGNTDYRGLSKFKNTLKLTWKDVISTHVKYKISMQLNYDTVYGINGREKYTRELLDDNESYSEIRDTYVQSTWQNTDLTIGRQIVVWGKADNLRIVDVLNPIDNRELGLTDLEDIRIPITMTRLDYYQSKWSLSAIIIHEIKFNRTPSFGSDYYVGPNAPADEIKPGSTNSEYAIALNGLFTGWELSLYAAKYYRDLTHLTNNKRSHSKIDMLGLAFTIPIKD